MGSCLLLWYKGPYLHIIWGASDVPPNIIHILREICERGALNFWEPQPQSNVEARNIVNTTGFTNLAVANSDTPSDHIKSAHDPDRKPVHLFLNIFPIQPLENSQLQPTPKPYTL